MTGSRPMLSVAVTGGIGSGKTLLCDVFRSLRIPVLSADDLSKEIADTVPAVRRRIRALLGPDSYTSRGSLDRRYVAERVFGRPRILRRLEGILHPAVLRKTKSWLAAHRKKGTRIAVVEAALVFESGLDSLVDIVVVVDAPKEERVRRVQARDGSSMAQIRRRMAAQIADKDRRERADIVVKNTGRVAEFRRKGKFLAQVFRSMVT